MARNALRMLVGLGGVLVLGTGFAATAAKGAADFRSDCATCHGVEGRGNGPMAKVLAIPPRDLTQLGAGEAFPYQRVYKTIDGRDLPLAHGTREMPIWGERYKPALGALGEEKLHQRIDALVNYLKTLQRS